MAYVTRNSASATVRIPECKGLFQYGDSVGMDPRYAADCCNAYTAQGVLKPMAACELLEPQTPAPIQTLARLYRRWYAPEDRHEVLVAAAGGQLYWMYPDSERWTKLDMPYGWDQPGYLSDVWSWAAYEINVEDRYAIIEPGVRHVQLYPEVRKHGLSYAAAAVGPGGSPLVTYAVTGGDNHVQYGASRPCRYLLGVEMVTPEGEILRTGERGPRTIEIAKPREERRDRRRNDRPRNNDRNGAPRGDRRPNGRGPARGAAPQKEGGSR